MVILCYTDLELQEQIVECGKAHGKAEFDFNGSYLKMVDINMAFDSFKSHFKGTKLVEYQTKVNSVYTVYK